MTGSTSTTSFSQNVTAAGLGTQSFKLTVNNNSQTVTATTNVTIDGSPDYQPLADLQYGRGQLG
ncbi:hypothetical protein GCM10027592_48000 [Spirosoma flavus]